MKLLKATKAVFSPSVPARKAVLDFLKAKRRKPDPDIVRLNDAVHTLVVAPTGVGKTSSIVIPLLLSCTDSMIVLDFKGELVQKTAAERERMGHRVVVIDPFNEVGGKDTFNPLAAIDKNSSLAPDDCRSVAAAMVVRTGKEQDPMWGNAAESEIALAIAFVVAFAEPHQRNLQSARMLLSSEKARNEMLAACMTATIWDGLLKQWAQQAMQLQGKTLSSVQTTVHSHMAFLDTLMVRDNTASTSFDLARIKQKTTIYLVMSPLRVSSQTGLLRLWIGSLLNAIMKQGLSSTPIHVLIDEASSVGELKEISTAIDISRGYGTHLLMLYQSLGQLKKCFPQDEGQTLLSNTTQVFFGVNDLATAEYVSNRLGDFTQIVHSGGSNDGRSVSSAQQGNNHSYSSGNSYSWQQVARRLLQPPEIMNLDPRIAITFHPGVPAPICTYLVRYYEGFLPRKMGWFKATCDTLGWFGMALIVAAISTAAFTLK